MLCEYGCNKEGNFKLKSGKYCCSDSCNKCSNIRSKNSKSHKGIKFSSERKKNISSSLKGRKLSYKTKNKLSEIRKGRIAWNKGIPHSKETKVKIGEGNRGKRYNYDSRTKISLIQKGKQKSKEHKEKLSLARKGKFTGKENPFYGRIHSKETIEKILAHPNRIQSNEKQKEYMLNGGASYLNSFITNPSKPQKKLYEMILSLCPYAVLNYPCLNYSIDIAIPFLNLAIEYDEPYWHQNKKADKKRQKDLEQEGWKFIRFDKLPDINLLKGKMK